MAALDRSYKHSRTLQLYYISVSSNIFYKLHTEAMSWMDAREFCRKDDGDLANVYPVPTRNLTDLVEANVDFTDVWVGMYVTPWVRLKGKRYCFLSFRK